MRVAFDAENRVKEVSAQRYLGSGPDARLEAWSIPIDAWETFEGVRVPSRGDAIWKLRDGDFSYYRWQITGIEYNPTFGERVRGTGSRGGVVASTQDAVSARPSP